MLNNVIISDLIKYSRILIIYYINNIIKQYNSNKPRILSGNDIYFLK